MRLMIYIAAAGAAGALGRYLISGWSYRAFGENFPYGTLVVNLAGCFLLGFLMELGMTTDVIPSRLRVAATAGFLGAFTTFSTFGYETVRLMEDRAWLSALANVSANVIFGLMLAWAGFITARAVTGGA